MQNNMDQEQRIVAAAKELFIRKGFGQTSMSDIAEAAGITRPALHYYFRTKEKMFQAVFGGIIQTLVPEMEGILKDGSPAIEKLSRLADMYISIFLAEPSLPVFIVLEIQRDAGHLLETASSLDMGRHAACLVSYFRDEMEKGNIRQVPMYAIFYTFFGLLAYPFLTRNLAERVFFGPPDDFEAVIRSWKPYVMKQLETLLSC